MRIEYKHKIISHNQNITRNILKVDRCTQTDKINPEIGNINHHINTNDMVTITNTDISNTINNLNSINEHITNNAVVAFNDNTNNDMANNNQIGISNNINNIDNNRTFFRD